MTERGTNSISSYSIDERGRADGPTTIKSSGQTPYGFDFTPEGSLIVTEAFGGEVGAAAASSYAVDAGEMTAISGSVGDSRSEVCWAAVTRDGRFAYVTNFGDGTISSYEITGDGSLGCTIPWWRRRGRGRRAFATKRSPATAASSTRSTPTPSELFGWTCGPTASWCRSAIRGRARDRRRAGRQLIGVVDANSTTQHR